jgi:hypothetical protein
MTPAATTGVELALGGAKVSRSERRHVDVAIVGHAGASNGPTSSTGFHGRISDDWFLGCDAGRSARPER